MKRNLFFYIKWGLAFFWANTFFKFERFLYKKFGKSKVKRRIFLSSGNISLINVLTILKQFPEENVEDTLVIDTPMGSKKFLEINKLIAQKHNFKKVLVANHERTLFFFLRKNLFAFDEIYAHTNPDYSRYIFPLFDDCKVIMFDEGINSIMEVPSPNNKIVTDVKMMKYCGKIDKIGWDNATYVNPDVNIFKEIANEITEKYPFDVEIAPESKTIIFLSSYWQAFNMSENEFYDYQNGIINKLIKNGFNVIYKQHPREEKSRKTPEGIVKTNCLLPMELYNPDILGVVSISSSASLQMYHYWGIPGFVSINEKTCDISKNISSIDMTKLATKEYVPDVEELLKINAHNYSKDELKEMLKNIFQNKLDSQPMLSENPVVRDYYSKYAEIENAKYKK